MSLSDKRSRINVFYKEDTLTARLTRLLTRQIGSGCALTPYTHQTVYYSISDVSPQKSHKIFAILFMFKYIYIEYFAKTNLPHYNNHFH